MDLARADWLTAAVVLLAFGLAGLWFYVIRVATDILAHQARLSRGRVVTVEQTVHVVYTHMDAAKEVTDELVERLAHNGAKLTTIEVRSPTAH